MEDKLSLIKGGNSVEVSGSDAERVICCWGAKVEQQYWPTRVKYLFLMNNWGVGGEQDNYWLIILVFNDNLYLVWEAVVKD